MIFFFNDTATTEIYTLSLHDALPICYVRGQLVSSFFVGVLIAIALSLLGVRYALLIGALAAVLNIVPFVGATVRSEEHTSELQSQSNLVCRLLLEKKTIADIRL